MRHIPPRKSTLTPNLNWLNLFVLAIEVALNLLLQFTPKVNNIFSSIFNFLNSSNKINSTFTPNLNWLNLFKNINITM
jgi:hypothetical protein